MCTNSNIHIFSMQTSTPVIFVAAIAQICANDIFYPLSKTQCKFEFLNTDVFLYFVTKTILN